MMLSKKLNSLKDLPELQPDYQWVQRTKYDLLAEISAQNRAIKASRLTWGERFGMLGMHFGVKVMASATKLVAMFLVLSLGSGVSLAAKASVPGEMLWPVKRSLEKAEVTLTLSPVKETEIHIKHINNRLNEIDKILNEEKTQDTDKKEKALKQATKHLEKDAVAADTSLKVAKEEKSAVEVIVLAEKVTNMAKETASNLEAKANAAPDQIIGAALDSAKQVNEDVKTSAVILALEVHQEVVAVATKQDSNPAVVASATAPVSLDNPKAQEVKTITEVVTKILNSEINDLSSELQTVQDKAAKVDSDNKVDVNIKVDGQMVTSAQVLKNNSQVAKTGLTEAKDLLDKGALKDSLDKITEVKEATKANETVLKEIEKINIEEEQLINNNTTTATTTKPIISTSTKKVIDSKLIIKSDGGEEVLPDSALDIKAEDGIKELESNLLAN